MRSRHCLAWPRAAIAPAVKALFDTWKCVPMLNGVHILVTGWWVRAIPGEWPSTSVSPALISLWLHCNYPRHASHCTPTKVTKPTPPTMLSLSSSWLRSVGSFRGHFHHSCPVRQGIKDITPHLMTTRNIRQRHGSVFQFNICSPHPPHPASLPSSFFLQDSLTALPPAQASEEKRGSNGQCGSLGNLQTIGSQPPAPYYFYLVFGYHQWYRPGPQEIQICYIGLQVLLLLPVVCQPTSVQDIAVVRVGISWPHQRSLFRISFDLLGCNCWLKQVGMGKP